MSTTTTQNHRLGIQVEQQGRVLIARLHGGPRGEFGREIAADLKALVARAETDDRVGAVVITGTHPDRFVAHANLRWLQEGGAASLASDRAEPRRSCARPAPREPSPEPANSQTERRSAARWSWPT
jgi:enoyl-CoA hydratase/carnithine racemase